MKAFLLKLFNWFRKKKPEAEPAEVVSGQVVTDLRPKQFWMAEAGPAQIELFDNDAQVISFLKECGAENIKVEVITPTAEGKRAVVYRKITKVPVV